MNQNNYQERHTKWIEINDDVATISTLIDKCTWRYKYFCTHTYPQKIEDYWEGTSQFIYFNRKFAEKQNIHLLPIFAIEPAFHRFGIHQILLSEYEIDKTQYRREWMKRKNSSHTCFGVGGLSSMEDFNPSLSGVGYIFERHIQQVSKVLCPRRNKCKRGCKADFPFKGLTPAEENSRIIKALRK